jgi:site-specific recombinase XerD
LSQAERRRLLDAADLLSLVGRRSKDRRRNRVGEKPVHPWYRARHAMGRHLIAKTGNMAAVQRRLGHKNASYSMQYARISDEELLETLDER